MRRAAIATLAAAGLAVLAATIVPLASGGSASAAAPTASARCSKAEATAAVKQLGLSDPTVPNPVFKVLCGAFAGPGSEAMVVSLFGQANSGMTDWVALRWTGSAWEVLMKRHQAATLTAAGTDIREVVSIYGFGDPRCCPSGGAASRKWHWTGSNLVSGTWMLSAPTAKSRYGFLKTPSGNILCDYVRDQRGARVDCVVQSGLKPPGPRRHAGCTRDIVVALEETRPVDTWGSECPGEDAQETPYVGGSIAWILGYGESLSVGGVRCASAMTGLTCRNKSGHGFFLSREKWRSF
jgi:hypothetical protein